MTNPTTTPDRDTLALCVFDALFGPHDHPIDILEESLRIVSGASDLLSHHGDMANFHGHSVDPAHIDAAAGAIRHQSRLIGALVSHLAAENRRLTETLAAQSLATNGGAEA